jgi:hypothetical protein
MAALIHHGGTNLPQLNLRMKGRIMKRTLLAVLFAAFAVTGFAAEQSASDWGALEQQTQYPQPGN